MAGLDENDSIKRLLFFDASRKLNSTVGADGPSDLAWR